MIILRLFLGLVLIFLLVAFATLNMTSVELNFYFYKTPKVPLFVVLYLCVLLGVVLAWVMVIGEQLRMRVQLKKKDKIIKELEEKLKSLEPQETPQEGAEDATAS